MDKAFCDQLLAQMGCGVLVIDRKGIIVFANEHLHELFGYPAGALISEPLEKLIPEEYRRKHSELLNNFHDHPQTRQMGAGNSFPALHADQTQFYVSISISPLDDERTIATITETTRQQAAFTDLTDKNRALNQSLQRLGSLAEKSTSALFIANANLKVTWANEAFYKLTGQTPQTTTDFFNLISRGASLSEVGRLHQAAKEQAEYKGELLLSNVHGEDFWAITEIQFQPKLDGKAEFIGSITDINAQKLLERKLIANSNLQRSMLNSAPILLFSTNEFGTVTLVNHFATENLNYQTVDLVGQITLFQLLTEESQQFLAQQVGVEATAKADKLAAELQKAAHKSPLVMELCFVKSDGGRVVVETTISAMNPWLENGKGLVWMGKNVSSERETLLQLSRTESLLTAVNDIAKLGVWELDLTTNQLWWSDEVYRIHELPIGSEISVEQGINYYAPEARDTIAEAVAEGIESGKTWDEQLPFITALGKRIWVRAIGYAESEENTPIKLRGAFQDITEIKDAEQKALAASQAKSEFLANMSHEIRTPLNGILGFNQLLAATALSDKQMEFVQLIASSGKNLLAIIDDILDVSRIEAGKLVINECPVNLSHLFFSIVENARNLVKEKGQPLRIEYSLATDVPDNIQSDPLRLHQIISNLVSNAIKCTDVGLVNIAVTKDKDQLLVAVSDTGIGIPAEAQATLFDKFTQVDSSSSRARAGVGLGLSICQELTGLLGGAISLHSELGKGSTFTVTLPIKPPVFAPQENSVENIAIVTDNERVVLSWQEYTASHGIQLQPLATAPEALKWIKESSLDRASLRVVIYQELTGMPGIELIKALHHQELVSPEQLSFVDHSPNAQHQQICTELAVNYFNSSKDSLVEIIGSFSDSHAIKTQQHQAASAQKLGYILLVEDNAINQMVAEEMLLQLGYRVMKAANGEEAIELVRSKINDISVILMDCQMPEMDGYEATRRIRSLNSHEAQTIPIIALTANARAEDVRACLDAGMTSHIAKPVMIDELKQSIELALTPIQSYDL